jgi:chromosome segregation protein
LAKILDDLSNKTQFIVITHNRASMRRASILYGVTMEENGVSKLLSVKLDDLKK